MRAYKLVRELKNGDITSLFINKNMRYDYGVWYEAQNHPTKGFAERPFFHCTAKMSAPHLKKQLKTGEKRVWVELEIDDYTEMNRPENQGGVWYLAKRINIIKKID